MRTLALGSSCRNRLLVSIAIVAILKPPAARAQSDTTAALEKPAAAVAALPVALYTAQANVQQVGDSAVIGLANEVLDKRLRELLGEQLVDRDRVITTTSSSAALDNAGGRPCNAVVACVRTVGAMLDAPWAVMTKVSKTSNLIWLLTGQLIHVPTGTIVLDDSTELKGDPEVMVRAGVRIFAERVARTVRWGGVTTNFPNGR